jgi:pimeloyl-ACP methyl ester carboxylesterase
MPTFSAADGVNIYYEVAGQGTPLLLSHEFAGDITSWEPQVNFFARRYRVITYCHRGYPPSDVPDDPAAYSQEHLVSDMRELLEHLGIEQAYIGGLSMGGSAAVSFAIAHPEMCRALIVASAGSGTTDRARLLASWQELSELMLSEGMEKFAEGYANGPERVQFRRKDPVGWEKFRAGLAAHSAMGSALMTQGVQLKRPTVFQLEENMRRLTMPTLLMVGDEDQPCIEPMLFMKQCIPGSGLAMFPLSGHAINLEEPALFNSTVLDFLTAVEAGAWPTGG